MKYQVFQKTLALRQYLPQTDLGSNMVKYATLECSEWAAVKSVIAQMLLKQALDTCNNAVDDLTDLK